MTRSDAVRQEALERDGYKCQISGVGGPEWKGKGVVEVDHWRNLGMGGSEELDTPENCITLSTEIHRMYKHPGVSIPLIRVTHWDPADLRGGLVVDRRLDDGSWERTPSLQLWFYRKQVVAHVAGCLGNMHTIQNLTGFHAFTMWELRLVWKDMYPDAASFDQVVSSLGWDPEGANDLADKHEWLMSNKAMWPEGLTHRQLSEIIDGAVPPTLFDSPDAEPTTDIQTLLSVAAEKSYSDLRKAMIEKGLTKAQPYYYLVMSSYLLPRPCRWPMEESYVSVGATTEIASMVSETKCSECSMRMFVSIVQTRDEERMKRAIREGTLCKEIEHPVVVRMGKAVLGVTARRNRFALADGTEIEVAKWPTENEEEA